MSTTDQELSSIRNIRIRTGEFGKRLFDIIGALAGLVVLSPIFGLVAIYIKRTYSSSVFYRGPRVGLGGKRFDILKFSTMSDGADSEDGPRVTAKDDPRVTPGGRWLRDTKLNEIPQLWNVLKGEMSLVGPRPEDPEIVATWTENERRSILSIRPGITSPASIFFRDEEELLETDSVMDKYLKNIVPSKLRLDQIYARDHGFLGDLDIIFLTAIALLPGVRTHTIPENMLTWGPLSRFFSRHLNYFLVDVPIALLAVGISGFLWRVSGALNLGWGRAILMAVLIALLFGFMNALLGMNRISWSHAQASDALGLAISGVIATGILYAADWFYQGQAHLPMGMWLLTGFLAFSGFTAVRYQSRLITGVATRWLQWRGSAANLGERVLIVGAGEMAQLAASFFRQGEPGKLLNIIGLVDDDAKKIGLRFDGNKVIGNTQDIPQLVERWDVGIILYAIGHIPGKQRKAILEQCRQTSARIVLMPDLLEMISGSLFAPNLVSQDFVSPNWDGVMPIPQVVNLLTELDGLVDPDNDALHSRLQQVRNALAAHVANDHAMLRKQAEIPTTPIKHKQMAAKIPVGKR